MAKVLIKKLDPAVQLPAYKSSGASGMDLMAFIKNPINVKPNSSSLIPNGLSFAFTENIEIQNISVLNTPGTIDSDYRGEIKVIIYNHSNIDFIINNGDRIAQMILTPVVKMELEETNELPQTLRGNNGFGSTGKWILN